MSRLLAVLIIAVFVVGIAYNLNVKSDEENKIRKFSSYEELENFVKSNLGTSSYFYGGFSSGSVTAERGMLIQASKTPPQDYSTTNIQVAGVDEPDVVKNDGKYIYTISGNKVFIIDAFPAEEAKILSTLEINGTPIEVFVNKDKLVVFGEQKNYYTYRNGPDILESKIVSDYYYQPKSFVYVYDISNRENPVLKRNIELSGRYVDSRMINDYVYVIANSPIGYGKNITLPTIVSNGKEKTIPANEIFYFDNPDNAYTFTVILAINTQNDKEEVTNKVILMGSTQNIFVSLNNIYITYQKFLSYYDFTDRLIDIILPHLPSHVVKEINKIRESDTASFEKFQSIGEVLGTYSQTLTQPEREELEKILAKKLVEIQKEILKEMQHTIIHKIAIQDGKIEYKSHGKVPGVVLNQFSMDEHNDYFRIATTSRNFNAWDTGVVTTQIAQGTRVSETTVAEKPMETITPEPIEPMPPRTPTTFNHVYVLDSNLKIVGKLENIAPDESIFSARFLGDRAYLVTFRRVDPLFVIDLSEPTNPKILGELKIPGFSDYLHPYDENHVIGIGKEVSDQEFQVIQGVKLGLFDVTDPTNPKEIAKYEIGKSGTDSEALRDHKAFLFSKEKNLLVIPILLTEERYNYVSQGAHVFEISLEKGFVFKGEIIHIPANQSVGYYFFSPYSVKRSLYIDGVLYTISDKIIKMNDLQNLKEINEIVLVP